MSQVRPLCCDKQKDQSQLRMILYAAWVLGELGKAFEEREDAFLQLRDLILTVKPRGWPVLWAGGGCQMETKSGPGLGDRAASVSSFPYSVSSAWPSSLVAKFLNNTELCAHRREEEVQSMGAPACATHSCNSCYRRTLIQKQSQGLACRGRIKELLGMKGGSNGGLVSQGNTMGEKSF